MAIHHSTWRFAIPSLGILAAIAFSAEIALGQYTFVQDTAATGNWNTTARWLDGGSNTTYPNAVDATVLFNNPIKTPSTGTYTLTLPATDVTVGQFKIDNTGFTNTSRDVFASGGGQLIFQSSSGPAKYIETVNTGTAPANTQNQIQANLLLNSDLEITQDNYPNLNTGTTFTGLVNGSSARTITKKGAAGIQFNYAFTLNAGEGFQGQYVIQAGSIRLINSSSAISKSTGFTVQSGGQLQLADNAATAVPDYNLASGAVLNLNGPGKAASSSNPDGALRIGITSPRTTTFHNPVVLQSDSEISVAAAGTTGTLDAIVSGTGSLTKHGSGTLILSNAGDSYSGDTKLLAGGPLSITNPFLADGRDVYLVTGSTLNLNFSATDTIRSLFIDGVAQATGTWGDASLSPNHPTTLITGGGLLQVTSAGGVPGDFNGNGVVDAGDYVLWRKGGPLQNEVDTPGTVNAQDYLDWRARFGNPPGSGSSIGAAAVPEPATLALFMFIAPLLAGRTLGRTRS